MAEIIGVDYASPDGKEATPNVWPPTGDAAPPDARPGAIVIYGLVDPRTGCLRYVGQSKSLGKRFSRHCRPNPKDRSHRGCWLRGLRNAKLKPELVVLEEAPSAAQAAVAEAFWIASLRAAGAVLVNTTDGALAPSRRGHTLTPEHRAKIAAAHIGIHPDEAARAKMRAARRDYRWSAATRAKHAATMAAKPREPKIRQHGTTANYQHGCRCDACVQANRGYHKQLRQAKAAARPPRVTPAHGTTTTYRNGCRCADCKFAAVSYATARKKVSAAQR